MIFGTVMLPSVEAKKFPIFLEVITLANAALQNSSLVLQTILLNVTERCVNCSCHS